MFADFQISRKLFSSFYVATIFSFLLFEIMTAQFTDLVNNLAGFFSKSFGWSLNQGTPNYWFFFFLTCIVFTFLFKNLVIQPLGFFTLDEGQVAWWDHLIMGFLVIGFYIFMFNQTFSVPMPRELIGIGWLKFFGGYKNTLLPNSDSSEQELSGWAFVKAFWYITPLAFLYIRTKVTIKTE